MWVLVDFGTTFQVKTTIESETSTHRIIRSVKRTRWGLWFIVKIKFIALFHFGHWLRKTSICHLIKNLLGIGERPTRTHTHKSIISQVPGKENTSIEMKEKKLINWFFQFSTWTSQNRELCYHRFFFATLRIGCKSIIYCARNGSQTDCENQHTRQSVKRDQRRLDFNYLLRRTLASTVETARFPLIIIATPKLSSIKLKPSIKSYNCLFHSDKCHHVQ